MEFVFAFTALQLQGTKVMSVYVSVRTVHPRIHRVLKVIFNIIQTHHIKFNIYIFI